MDRAAGTHHHHGGGWVCHGSWLATKKKKVRRLVQQHHKRKLCPQSRFGRKRWMCAVLLYDSCKGSPMGHWLGQKQLQWAKPKSRSGRDLTEQMPWRSWSATWCRDHLYDKLRLLTSGRLPWRRALPPAPDCILECSQGPQGPARWTPCVLLGLHLRSSKHYSFCSNIFLLNPSLAGRALLTHWLNDHEAVLLRKFHSSGDRYGQTFWVLLPTDNFHKYPRTHLYVLFSF